MVNSSRFITHRLMTKLCFFSLSLFLMLLSLASFAATPITVAVDRNPVSISDSFQLTFTATQSPDDEPDFNPLKQNFDIINQQKSSQSSWINGKSSKTISWELTLMAKKLGDISIPSIAFGSDVTKPLSITVKDTSNTQIDQTAPLFLNVTVSTKKAYVQSQIIYTVRVYQRINMTQASLSEPTADNLIVETLGDDKSYDTQIKGINYHVVERNYALFPQQSGSLKIPPLVLTAQTVSNDPNDRFNSFFSMQQTQTKRVVSNPITINVLPAPAEFTDKHWLPAQKVSLAEGWTNKQLTVNTGEPITRTIQIQAEGITSSQLPDLNIDYNIDNLKTYPDKVESHQKSNANGISTISQQKIAIIASQPGKYTLPAIDIPWFNTTTNTVEHATLPAATITVTGVAQQPSQNTITKSPAAVVGKQAAKTEQTTSLAKPDPTNSSSNTLWKWVAISFAVLWVITLFILVKFRKTKIQKDVPNETTPKTSSSNTIKILKQACEQNDAKMALEALNNWGKEHYQREDWSLMLEKDDNDKLKIVLNELNQSLYSPTSKPWQAEKLLQLINENYFLETKNSSKTSQIEPLNRI